MNVCAGLFVAVGSLQKNAKYINAYHKCTFKDGWTNKNEFHRRVQIYEVITSHTNYRVGESKHHPKLVKKMNEINAWVF